LFIQRPLKAYRHYTISYETEKYFSFLEEKQKKRLIITRKGAKNDSQIKETTNEQFFKGYFLSVYNI
jgi:hypothetical protein